MKLSKLLAEISDVEIYNFRDVEITAITQNSKEAHPYSLFVAIPGAHADGADFIPEAYARGARAFVTERKIDFSDDKIVIYSKNTRKTLAELCAKMAGNPEKKLLFVGITGTKGKTSTSFLLSKIFDFLNVKNIVIGTLGVYGTKYKSTPNTTPDPTFLFPIFKSAVHEGIKVVILEVSSQALKYYRVYGISFDCVAFTGLSRDHIGESEHPKFSDYLFSKRRLFTSFGAKRAVINFDDAYSSYISSGIPKVVKCGFSKGSDYLISDFSDSLNGSNFLVCGKEVRTSLPGEYNARNTAMALALASEITGCRIEEVAASILKIRIPGRFDLKHLSGRNIIVDYAHNAESFKEVFIIAKRLFPGRIICVFGSVGERSYERRRELAEVSGKYADFSIITSDNPGYESPLSICTEIYNYFTDKEKAVIITDRAEAIAYAFQYSKAGDTIMILGKGNEKTMNINGEKIEYSDDETIQRIGSI